MFCYVEEKLCFPLSRWLCVSCSSHFLFAVIMQSSKSLCTECALTWINVNKKKTRGSGSSLNSIKLLFVCYSSRADRTSDTLSGPPNLSMSSSKVLRGSSFPSTEILLRRPCFISSSLAVKQAEEHQPCDCDRGKQQAGRTLISSDIRRADGGGGSPVWQLVWFTKITSSLSSSESGDELESVSMPSESLLLSSLMLITPPLSTVCLGTLGWRPLGFPGPRAQTGIRDEIEVTGWEI